MVATSPRGQGAGPIARGGLPAGRQPSDTPAADTRVLTDWTEIPVSADGVTLTETVSGLTDGELYRWRAHVLYAPLHCDEPGITPPPVPRHGPWRRLFAMAPAADIRVGEPQQVTISEFTNPAGRWARARGRRQRPVVMVTTSDGEATAVPVSVEYATLDNANGGRWQVDYVGTNGTLQIVAGVPDGHLGTDHGGL